VLLKGAVVQPLEAITLVLLPVLELHGAGYRQPVQERAGVNPDREERVSLNGGLELTRVHAHACEIKAHPSALTDHSFLAQRLADGVDGGIEQTARAFRG
jgi:hypothetical protein